MRLTPAEAELLDAQRGRDTRAGYLRRLLAQAGTGQALIQAATITMPTSQDHRHIRDHGTVVGTRMGREVRAYHCTECGLHLVTR